MQCRRIERVQSQLPRPQTEGLSQTEGDYKTIQVFSQSVSQSVIFIYKARLKTTAVGQSAVQK